MIRRRAVHQDLLTVQEAADLLQVTPARVYQLVWSRVLPKAKKGQRLHVSLASILIYRRRRDTWLRLHGRKIGYRKAG